MKSVLVVTARQIGDVLLTTPLIRRARELWPQASIDVLGVEGSLGTLSGNGDVSRTITVPAKPGLRGLIGIGRQLWRRYDLALIAEVSDRAHLIGWMAARQRSGLLPEQGGSRWLKKLSLHHGVAGAGDRGTRHVAAEKLLLLQPWLPAAQEAPRIVPPAPAALPAWLDESLSPAFVVVHSPSMWAYKQWPMAHFRELVGALLEQGHQVVLTGSAGAHDRACVDALAGLAAPPRLLDVSGQLDFNQLAALLSKATLYIGPDTSVSHLAAACATPTLAILGPTNPMRWAPWPAHAGAQDRFDRRALSQTVRNVTVIQSDLPCVPCGRAGCEDHRDSRSDCLRQITPARVLDEARRILGAPDAAGVHRKESGQ